MELDLGRERAGGASRWALAGISALGAADVAEFMATSPAAAFASPGRAAGSALGLALWLTLGGLAVLDAGGHRSSSLARGQAWSAAALVLGSVVLVGVHAAAHVGGVRPALGAGLALAAAGLVWVGRRP